VQSFNLTIYRVETGAVWK